MSIIQFEHPRYTRYELGKMVRDKRRESGLSIKDFASLYEVDSKMLHSIEEGSRCFNIPMYKTCMKILNLSKEEILAKEKDSFEIPDSCPREIQEAVLTANQIFNEMIMQEKIAF